MLASKTLTIVLIVGVLMVGVIVGSFLSNGTFVLASYTAEELELLQQQEMERAELKAKIIAEEQAAAAARAELKAKIMAEEQIRAAARAEAKRIDGSTLEQLYLASFGRPVDEEGKKFHAGKDLNQVLNDINNSPERRYYSALFKAVKAYEEAVRAPGTLSADDKQKYLDSINSALSTLLAWVDTLPEQNICRGVVGILEARQAIQDAYDKMSPEAKAAAQKGVFNALESLPKDLPLPLQRCLVPTPTPTPVN